MNRDLRFEIGECTFERIRSVWDAKIRMMLTGEEPREVCFQTPVGAAETFVSVVPPAGDGIDGFLCEEIFPFLMPELQPVSEACFICLREKQNELLELLARFKLGLTRDVSQNDHHLMELTHLDGNIRKGLHKTSSRIADNTNDVPSALSQGSNACNIFRNRFVREKFPEKILAAMGTAEHHDSEDFSEVRCIHHDHDITDNEGARLHLCTIHALLHPPSTSTDLLPDLC